MASTLAEVAARHLKPVEAVYSIRYFDAPAVEVMHIA